MLIDLLQTVVFGVPLCKSKKKYTTSIVLLWQHFFNPRKKTSHKLHLSILFQHKRRYIIVTDRKNEKNHRHSNSNHRYNNHL